MDQPNIARDIVYQEIENANGCVLLSYLGKNKDLQNEMKAHNYDKLKRFIKETIDGVKIVGSHGLTSVKMSDNYAAQIKDILKHNNGKITFEDLIEMDDSFDFKELFDILYKSGEFDIVTTIRGRRPSRAGIISTVSMILDDRSNVNLTELCREYHQQTSSTIKHDIGKMDMLQFLKDCKEFNVDDDGYISRVKEF